MSIQRQHDESELETGPSWALRGSRPAPRASHPLLAALRRAGTAHVYVDTADTAKLARLTESTTGKRLADIDGNTVNQPLVHDVLDRLVTGDFGAWLREQRRRVQSERALLAPSLYSAAILRIGQEVVRRFGATGEWQLSLQIHMGAAADFHAATDAGRRIHRTLPGTLVKVPFLPDRPQALLAARELERSGIPVNLTSTFSARQCAVAALLVGATRANVFMGRLNQGLSAQALGEHVDLETQRMLLGLRRAFRTSTRLIVASVRDWHVLVRNAGCDVFTVPPDVLRAFLHQGEVAPDEIASQLGVGYADRLGIPERVQERVPRERIERLWRVEPELLEFLTEYRHSREFRELQDGAKLRQRFEQAGFGDLFHEPDADEAALLRASKLPDADGAMVGRVALDTLFSLHANADFQRHQEEIDEVLLEVSGALV